MHSDEFFAPRREENEKVAPMDLAERKENLPNLLNHRKGGGFIG